MSAYSIVTIERYQPTLFSVPQETPTLASEVVTNFNKIMTNLEADNYIIVRINEWNTSSLLWSIMGSRSIVSFRDKYAQKIYKIKKGIHMHKMRFTYVLMIDWMELVRDTYFKKINKTYIIYPKKEVSVIGLINTFCKQTNKHTWQRWQPRVLLFSLSY